MAVTAEAITAAIDEVDAEAGAITAEQADCVVMLLGQDMPAAETLTA